jgi:predicted Zn-dependent protease
VYADGGELGDAQKLLDEGMRRQPDSALGHFLLGSLDMRMGKLQEAEAALRHAIQLSPAMAQPRLQLIITAVEKNRGGNAVHAFISAFPNAPLQRPRQAVTSAIAVRCEIASRT